MERESWEDPDEEMKEGSEHSSYMEQGQTILWDFFAETGMDKNVILPTMKTLTKVLENLIQSPMEPKFRSLDSTKKAVHDKLI